MSAARTGEISPRAADAARWAAELGAVTAEALAIRSRVSVASARAVLRSAERRGLVTAARPLHRGATLYSATAMGLRTTDARALGITRVSASNAAHLTAVALVAAGLQRRHPDHRVQGSASCGATSVSRAGRSRARASARRPTAARCCTGRTSCCGRPARRRRVGRWRSRSS